MARKLITAGLPYSNGRLHVGHIGGAYLPADIYVRYRRMCGDDVRFVCGSDDHGVAITMQAEKEGKSPKEVATFYNERQQEDFAGLNINFDVYGSTCGTSFHRDASQKFFQGIFDKGYFEKISTKQFYDPSKEMFLPDRYVRGTCGYCGAPDQNSDQCEQCGRQLDIDHLNDAVSVASGEPAEIRESTHWFLDLRRMEDEVRSWLDKAEMRDQTRSFVTGLLSSGLVKRAMTRDLEWGIPVPIDDPDAEGKVLYVWFDAPIGYISNTMQLCDNEFGDAERYVDWWKSEDCEISHFIGEDNTVFHCVIWIAMLKLQGGYQLPKAVVVNHYYNIQFPGEEAQKISKSKGTAVWIGEYLADGNDPDSLRYYLTANASEKSRSVYQPEELISKHNADLCNTLGNLFNRVLSMSAKNVGEKFEVTPLEQLREPDRELLAQREEVLKQVSELIDAYQFRAALNALMDFARSCNRFVDQRQPWSTKKTDPEDMKSCLSAALHALTFLSVTLTPFIPTAASRMRALLGNDSTSENIDWGTALNLRVEFDLQKKPDILFARIE